ncbi:hypothetical protein ACROYT_G041604 [Oculina patagonica]
MASSANGNDAKLAAFIDTVVNIENDSLPTSERIVHPSNTDKNPNITEMGQDDDAGNCILLQRVYYFSEENRMQKGCKISEVASTASFENSRWSDKETINSRTLTSASCKQRTPCLCENEYISTRAVHFPRPETPFVCPSYEQTSTYSFLRRKNMSMETMNFKQQWCTAYNSEGHENYTEVNEAENAGVPDTQRNVLTIYHDPHKSEEVLTSSWSSHFSAYEQVTEHNGTPPVCLPQRRTYHPKNCSRLLSDQICKHCLHNAPINPSSDYQLENENERTIEKMHSESWNRNINSANAELLSEVWQYYKQNENEVRSQSVPNLSSWPMQTASPNPVPCLQVQPSDANVFEDRGPRCAKTCNRYNFRPKHPTTDYHTQRMMAAELTPEEWHADEVRETDKTLQNLYPIYDRRADETGCKWPLEYYHDHQGFVENQIYADEAFPLFVESGKHVSGGVKRVLPRSHFGFGEERYNCATVKETDNISTLLWEGQQEQNVSQIEPSRPVLENIEGGDSFASVPDCCSDNCLVSQESSSDLDERSSPYNYLLMEDERADKAPIIQRQSKASSLEGDYNPGCEKRSSNNQEINAHLHSSHGIVQRTTRICILHMASCKGTPSQLHQTRNSRFTELKKTWPNPTDKKLTSVISQVAQERITEAPI